MKKNAVLIFGIVKRIKSAYEVAMKTNQILLFRSILISSIALSLMMAIGGCDSSSGSSGPKGSITVLAMGDSQTSGGIYPGVAPWTSNLAALEPEWRIVNSAVAGERSSQGLARLPANLSRHNPDVVLLMFGANNAIQGDLAGFRPQMQRMVALCKESGAKVVIVNILPMRGGRSIYNGNVDRLNAELLALAKEEKVGYVDAFKEFRGDVADERLPDGLHPDADGNRILAVAIREDIRKRF